MIGYCWSASTAASAKKHLPTCPSYASEGFTPSPSVPPKSADALLASGNSSFAAPTEPVPKPEVVAALEQTNVATDATPTDGAQTVKLHGPIAALYLAPLPPRRPSDPMFQLASLGPAPLPPVRPLAPNDAAVGVRPPPRPIAFETTASIKTAPSPGLSTEANSPVLKRIPTAANSFELPKIITLGTSAAPTLPPQPLALAEVEQRALVDDSILLARAAELTAPVPPAPGSESSPAAAKAPLPALEAGLATRLAHLLFGSLLHSGDHGASSADVPGVAR